MRAFKRLSLLVCLGLSIIGIFVLFKQHKPGIPFWAQEQIQEDLAPYQKAALTQDLIEDTFNAMKSSQEVDIVRYQVIQGKIYYEKNWEGEGPLSFTHFTQSLKKLAYKKGLPNVDFLVQFNSLYPHIEGDAQVPIFYTSKKEKSFGVLIPAPEHITNYQELKSKIEEKKWGDKVGRLYWRGLLQDEDHTLDNWYEFSDSKLVLLSKYYPEQIDAYYTSIETSEDLRNLLLQHQPLKGPEHPENYKYLIHFDNEELFFPKLFSNSVVFIERGGYQYWFSKALKPYIHYLPLENGISNLPEQVQWAQSHDPEAKMMAHEASLLAQKELNPQKQMQYLYTLLQEYSKLMPPTLTPLKTCLN